MPSRKSPEIPNSSEITVVFDKDDCCALEHGFKMNPEVGVELEKTMGKGEINLLDALLKTAGMKFHPSENMRIVYGQIAKRELERIEAEDDGEDLFCEHTIQEHQEALRSVIEKMASVPH